MLKQTVQKQKKEPLMISLAQMTHDSHPWKDFWLNVKKQEELLVDYADRNCFDQVKVLLETKDNAMPFDVNSMNGLDGWSAVYYAVFNDNLRMVQLLQQYNAKVDVINSFGSTLLHISVQIKSIQMTKYLFQFIETKKNDQDSELNTPLHIAAQQNDKEMISFLLQQGCNASIKNQQLLQPVNLVTDADALDIFQQNGIDTNSPSKRRKINNKIIMISSFDTKLKLLNTFKVNYSKQYNKENMCGDKIQLKKLRFVLKLGQGAFGEVYKVYDTDRDEFYALKCINRNKIEKDGIIKYILTEKEILSKLDSKYIIQLKGSFQNEQYLFILEEYVQGEDMNKYLKRKSKLTEEEASKFIIQIAKGLYDLHQAGYIYRDLKPHNVMVLPDGRIKLIDFGLSKRIEQNSTTTFSFCGSLAYLAPEMLRRQGHDKSIDFYLLGVLFYEMLHGKIPYYDSDSSQCFNNILKGKLVFDDHLSYESVTLIKELLSRNPKLRPSFSEISCNELFQSIDLAKLHTNSSPLKQQKYQQINFIQEVPFNFEQKNNHKKLNKWDWNIHY